MKRRVCVVGVGLSDGPVTPNMSAVMLEAQSFRRALDDAGLEKSDVEGLASAAGMKPDKASFASVGLFYAYLAFMIYRTRLKHRIVAWVMLVVFCLPVFFYVLRLALDVLGR